MIEVSNLVKTFVLNKKQIKEMGPDFTGNKVNAVNSINFKCEPGKIYSLLGPNGAGKTTTLRMLATIFKPTSGSINICGIDVGSNPREARRNIGFLTGSTGLYARLTPNELVKYFADLYEMDKALYAERKEYLFELLGINEFGNKQIGKLSTGMKQKVSIARTVIHNPPVVIFDEPTSGLDVITSEAIVQLIRDCKSENKTVIFSTHIMSEVDRLCDDLGIIHKGTMLYDGSYDAFKAQHQGQNLVEAFVETVNAV